MSESSNNSFRQLPAVNAVLDHASIRPLIDEQGRETVLRWVREELEELRDRLSAGEQNGSRELLLENLCDRIAARANSANHARIGAVINATGVILHTGLGRAPLSQAAANALQNLSGAGNVEIDLESTDRRYRGHQLLTAWQTLTGCEDAVVVNNNAAATLLTLQALCAGREVMISRGQLIEIGGSFRLPDIFELSGAKLREVGTTNRTQLSDYQRAITDDTAAIMLVHPSNYRIVGFTQTSGITELAALARDNGLTMIDDVGSGCLVDVTRYGLPAEPTFSESIAAGADVVLGSGDKLLGGPQAGIILGKAGPVERIRNHPLARAVRVGKLTLAALSATLDSYLRETAETDIPTLRLLAAPSGELLERAHRICNDVGSTGPLAITVQTATALVGGGSLPAVKLPTAVLSLQHAELSSEELARQLRLGSIHLFCRLHHDAVLVDLRSVQPEDDSRITLALRLVASSASRAAGNHSQSKKNARATDQSRGT